MPSSCIKNGCFEARDESSLKELWYEGISTKQQLYLPSEIPNSLLQTLCKKGYVVELIAALWFPIAHQAARTHVLIFSTH